MHLIEGRIFYHPLLLLDHWNTVFLVVGGGLIALVSFLLEILGLNTNFICFLIFLSFTAQFMLFESEMMGALRFVP